jgi:hypothetical protein
MSSKKKKSKGYKSVVIKAKPPPPVVSVEDADQEEVEEAPIQDVDYSEGVLRRHHLLFIDSGDFFLQVGVPNRVLSMS